MERSLPRSFTLLKKLGEGSFGAVHLAEVRGELDLVQTLAVKWLHPEWSGKSEIAARLRDEARLLALLQHENIVRVHGLTYIEDRLAILMEPIEGADLAKLKEPMPIRAALETVEATADALAAAWEKLPPNRGEPLRVVHRDIKPSNIMISSRGAVKVMDFGVARATFREREATTKSQQYGTARYMAPERWLHGEESASSDVYSLGITLIEILSMESVPRLRLSPGGFQEDHGAAVSRLQMWPEVRELVSAMCAYEEEERPSASQVAARCRSLSAGMVGPGLKDWCHTWVPCQEASEQRLDSTVVLEDDGETYDVGDSSTLLTADYSEETWQWPAWWVLILYGAMIEAILVALAGLFSGVLDEAVVEREVLTSHTTLRFELLTEEEVVAPFGSLRSGEVYSVPVNTPILLRIGSGDEASECRLDVPDEPTRWAIGTNGSCNQLDLQ
jgi:serine/threonine protein kinase